MLHFVLTLSLLVFTAVTTHAQCDKKVTWQASKCEFMDAYGAVVHTEERPFVTTTSDTKITLEVKGAAEEGSLTGVVKEITTCAWKEPYKNGKTVYKVDLTKPSGNASSGTMTIEAIDEKITVLIELEKMQGGKIRLVIEKYEVE